MRINKVLLLPPNGRGDPPFLLQYSSFYKINNQKVKFDKKKYQCRFYFRGMTLIKY